MFNSFDEKNVRSFVEKVKSVFEKRKSLIDEFETKERQLAEIKRDAFELSTKLGELECDIKKCNEELEEYMITLFKFFEIGDFEKYFFNQTIFGSWSKK